MPVLPVLLLVVVVAVTVVVVDGGDESDDSSLLLVSSEGGRVSGGMGTNEKFNLLACDPFRAGLLNL